MPTSTALAGLTVPVSGDAGNVPADMLTLANQLDSLVVLKASSQANRDTLYANAPAGTLVSCALSSTTGIVWMKTTTPPTAAAWIILAERQAAVTTGVVTAATNFSVTSQWAQRVNGMITISAILGYSGTTVTAGGNSDLSPDVSVCTIQSTYLPPASLLSNGVWPSITLNAGTGQGYIDSSGVVKLGSLTPGNSLSSGLSVRFTTVYPGA